MFTALRLLTFTAYAALATSLGRAARRTRPASGAAGRAWRWLAGLYGIIAVNLAVAELRSAYRPFANGTALAFLFGRTSYHTLYLLQTIVGALIPMALLAVLPRDPRWRRVSRVMFGIVAAIAVGAVAMGALASWELLLASTSLIYVVAGGAHLVFWALLALGALERVGRHLPWLVAFETVFVLILPVEEVFFRFVVREENQIWFLNVLHQAVTALAQLAVVWWLLRSTRRTEGSAVGAAVGSPEPTAGLSG